MRKLAQEMIYAPGTELLASKEGQPTRVFVVDSTGRFAVRGFGHVKRNKVDGKWYEPAEYIHLETGGSFTLTPDK